MYHLNVDSFIGSYGGVLEAIGAILIVISVFRGIVIFFKVIRERARRI